MPAQPQLVPPDAAPDQGAEHSMPVRGEERHPRALGARVAGLRQRGHHVRSSFVTTLIPHAHPFAARMASCLPITGGMAVPHLASELRGGVVVLTPRLPEGTTATSQERALRSLLDEWLHGHAIDRPVLWYYTPMALSWTAHIPAAAVVYDCMDHLAGFRGAPHGVLDQEARLIARADLLFTGGARLHELKRQDHQDAHCFPSSVDADHFRTARRQQADPADQASLPRPRIGYAGVIDERIDMSLIDALAVAEPDWSVVLLGPVVKIDPADIPARHSVRTLGMKDYRDLPAYLAGWDLAIMPFAHNEATAYISPTKTPEYLAAGVPVASTSIRDVVQPYGLEGLVEIGDGPEGFVAACRRAIQTDRSRLGERVDRFLATRSWDLTWAAIDGLLAGVVRRRRPIAATRIGHAGPPSLVPGSVAHRSSVTAPIGAAGRSVED